MFWVSDHPPVVVGPVSLMEGEERMRGRGGGETREMLGSRDDNSFIQFSYFIKTTIQNYNALSFVLITVHE